MRLFSNGLIHKEENFEIYLINMRKLNKKYKSIENWRLNRPIDQSRIKVIKQYLPFTNAQKNGAAINWENFTPIAPTFTGTKILEN